MRKRVRRVLEFASSASDNDDHEPTSNLRRRANDEVENGSGAVLLPRPGKQQRRPIARSPDVAVVSQQQGVHSAGSTPLQEPRAKKGAQKIGAPGPAPALHDSTTDASPELLPYLELHSTDMASYADCLRRWLGRAASPGEVKQCSLIVRTLLHTLVRNEVCTREAHAEIYSRCMHLADRVVCALGLEGKAPNAAQLAQLAALLLAKSISDFQMGHQVMRNSPVGLEEMMPLERDALRALDFCVHVPYAALSAWCVDNVHVATRYG